MRAGAGCARRPSLRCPGADLEDGDPPPTCAWLAPPPAQGGKEGGGGGEAEEKDESLKTAALRSRRSERAGAARWWSCSGGTSLRCWRSSRRRAVEDQLDNAFFPNSRPPHLEELHVQAQAGLKSLQNLEKQKKTRKIWDHSETSSVQSSQSTEGDDISIRSQASSCATADASEDAMSVRSEMIQRKGSTFRPHDSFLKPSGKGEKRRRERRTTVLGLPQHVQQELGLSNGRDSAKRPGSIAVRAGPSPQPLVNGSQLPGTTIQIPTVDGKPQGTGLAERGARVSLQALEAHASEAALQRHISRLYYDDSVLDRKTAATVSPVARPKSLAVPWMTTQPSSPELLSPVMSISPQGTYLSKIIPNAILPPMVDVIALSCNRPLQPGQRQPALSVRSTGHFPAAPRSREHSSSIHRDHRSNASTISSHGGRGGQKDDAGLSSREPPTGRPDRLSPCSPASSRKAWAAPASPSLLGGRPGGSSGRASPAYSTSSLAEGSDDASVRSDRSSTRSVSLRKRKAAPLPPRRTYSLHQKAQQLEAEGAPRGMGLPPKPERRPQREGTQGPSLAGEDDVFSPIRLGGTGSLQSSSLACSPDISSRSPGRVSQLREPDGAEAQEPGSPHHFGRTMSPSSGYSSQSGTPTLHPKSPLPHTASPGKKRPQPRKPERVCSLQSPGPSLSSSSLTSLSSSASDPAPPEGTAQPTPGCPQASSPAAPHYVDRFVIPPHPKVPAPFSPPPNQPKSKEGMGATLPPSSQPPLQGSPLNKEGSPPPSPPPAYHPPPPPVKKAEPSAGDPGAALVPSEAEVGASTDPLWLPPPPPLMDEQDLLGKPPLWRQVSANFPQPGIQALPAPSTEPSPLPKASPSGELSSPQLGSRHPTTSGVAGPSSLSPQIKKPPTGSHPDLKKEPAMRSKAASVPKEDASLPIVTPSLLQMVRLRSVDVEAHGPGVSPAGGSTAPTESGRANVAADGKMGSSAPQKPLRKSLSLRGGQPASREGLNPLHEAVRLKASTLTSREALSLGMAERKTGSRAALPGTPPALASNGPVSPLHKLPCLHRQLHLCQEPQEAGHRDGTLVGGSGQPAEKPASDPQRPQGCLCRAWPRPPRPRRSPLPLPRSLLLGRGTGPPPKAQSPPAEEVAVEERTKKVGSESQSPPVESGDGCPPAGPEDQVRRSPRAQ
ncbi:hypothetical protein E2320_000268, partial [Naja naja]